jgi:integrase
LGWWLESGLKERDRLTAISLRRRRDPGLYPDGAGLYLQVTETGTQSWILKFTLKGHARQMGLGPTSLVSLADARRRRDDAQRLLLDGVDPIEARRSARQATQLAAVKVVTFKEAATAYISAHETEWRNSRHARQWPETLSAYVYPTLGLLPVQTIDTALVLKVLEPIWATIPETASRVRGRIESVLNWASARGYRSGENPARWRGHLDNLLPARDKVQKVKHHPALPYPEIGPFMATLRQEETIPARALEFLILTAARSGEVHGARWDEIDLDARLWTVPGDRMKGGKEHRVPLSDAAVVVLEQMWPLQHDLVFPGARNGRMPSKAPFDLLRRMGRDDLTAHGFRSTFRDWAAEVTHFPNEMVEMALAHAVGSKVEAAYRRGDMFEKRRRLMADWADYCARLPATDQDNIIPMRGASPIPA